MCVLPMASNYRSVVFKHQALLDFCAASLLSVCIDSMHHEHGAAHPSRSDHAADVRHWHASQSGLSIEQNLMSLAGASSMLAGSAAACMPDVLALLDTAFSAPAAMVDFSACVAPIVRR